ncbi:MAG: hypothetical protein IJH12_06325 [Clostridia bacterium]|nr:hypothetical protein [Clostridia bacterium]
MKKMMSLIKACMTDNMSLFKIKKKDKSKKNGKGLTIFLLIIVGLSIYSYANTFLDALIPNHMEHVLFSLFGLLVTILIIIEGVYKAGALIFNCKDDDLLLSLPIRKSTVVFIRILKFYTFEVLYGSLLLIPANIAYATRVSTTSVFYLISVVAIFVLPMIPIAISSIIGVITSATSTKFKNKSIIQIIISMIALVGILYLSFNLQGLIANIGSNAAVINETISKYYYPVGIYSKLYINFDIREFLIFIGINILVFTAMIFVISKVYFKVNSGLKRIQKNNGKKSYKVRCNKPQVALVKKELKKAFNTPVLIINAVLGMVLLVIASVAVAVKFNDILNIPQAQMPFTPEKLNSCIPIILVLLVTFGSLTSSITSSMISLEGKSFTILKSLPVKPFTIIMDKVYTAVFMMMPFVLVSDLIFYIRFKFNIAEIILTLIASILLPFIAELIGILVNLRYPEMRADTDAEVVKQSGSSNISTMIGFLFIIAVTAILMSAVLNGGQSLICLATADVVFLLICVWLLKRAKTKGVERFKNIDV